MGSKAISAYQYCLLYFLILDGDSAPDTLSPDVVHYYKLTSQRLYVKTGVFSQTIEQTELYRIRDYTVKKPLKQRIFGLGTLEIISSDKTQPNIHLTAIKDPEGVADLLREGVELSRRATQTREVDFT